MAVVDDLKRVQSYLTHHGIDGWLIYDFRGTNQSVYPFLRINPDAHITRRFFYWVPAIGEPVQIVHAIESGVLGHLPGERRLYLRWQTLEERLRDLLKGARLVAMEYSPRGAVPYVSHLDAGTAELVVSYGVELVSSSNFLQELSCRWTERQYQLHLEAKECLLACYELAWDLVRRALVGGKRIGEYEVQLAILEKIRDEGCTTSFAPIVAVREHSASPHYSPSKESSYEIRKGDFLLIDLGCKRTQPEATYADMTRVAVCDATSTTEQEKVFSIVRGAQLAGTRLIQDRLSRKEEVMGCEVDQACRQVIEEAGYGEQFLHRTGHNIHTDIHGPGANLDSLETLDERILIEESCFSVEPGIYLEGNFGVRLENDLFIHPGGKLEITTGEQTELLRLL